MLSSGMVLVGKYRIDSVIGQGGLGQVYLGYDLDIGRPVAIKELPRDAEHLSPDEWELYQERFRRETRTVGQFTHPNVVSVYALEADSEGNLYLVLEYVDGGSLKDLLQAGTPLSIERALDIASDICRAVEAIYQRDIVHRDIKPGNILVSESGAAKLTDFGVAQVGHETHRTQETTLHPGTPAYKSPEQSTTTRYLDQRSDLYSLGLVLYEMLAGRPYVRDRLPLRHHNPQVPPSLEAVVTQALQENPEDRYQTAAELRRDLERVQAESVGGQLQIVMSRLSFSQIFTTVGLVVALALITGGDRFAAAFSKEAVVSEATMTAEAASVLGDSLASGLELAGAEMPQEAAFAPDGVTPTATAEWNDAYEPDDEAPVSLSIGETQLRSFAPDGDVDRAVFRVKAGRSYLVTTANLSVGVDTKLDVQMNGLILSNDDMEPGTLASQVTFTAQEDGLAVITVSNQDQYGPERTYDLSVFVIDPTPTSTTLPTTAHTLPPSITPRATYTPRPTFTLHPTGSITPTRTGTVTRTITPYLTRTPTSTRTPWPTSTPSVTSTPSDTPLPTETPLPTDTPLPERTSLPVKTVPPVR